VKNRHDRGHAIDPLKAEAQINKHPGERISSCQERLPAQLRPDLRPDNFNIADAEIGEKKSIRQRSYHRWIDPPLELVE
jgi:hypothetical protein